jgi:hypothetical protein
VPVISRFFGIVIFMNYNDPEPPHFHARYQDQEIIVEIQTGVVIGRMSKRALRMVLEWSDQHQEELLENWRLARWEAASEGDSTSAVGVGRMFLHVQAVRHLERYQLRIEFDNGVTKEIDLEGELHGEVF